MDETRYSGIWLRMPRGHDLDRYIFTDDKHAREWLSQKYLQGEPFIGISIGTYRKRKCCGEEFGFKAEQNMTAKQFLERKPTSAAAR